jgi:CelD/BcsL family acetyltransferase involved in cellulose biosynthesis
LQAAEPAQGRRKNLKIKRENERVLIAIMSSVGMVSTITLKTSMVTDEAGYEELGEEWDELLEQSEQRVFFLRWGWTRAWWRKLRPAGSRLFIITCRDERGRLAGLAPFYVKQRRTAGIPHAREVMFLGTGVYAQTSEYLDLIARRGREREVAEAVAERLKANREWDRLWLNEAPSGSKIFSLFQEALGDGARVEICNRSHHIDTTTDWETFRQSLSRSTRKHLTRQIRRFFDAYDCEFSRVSAPDELEEAMNELVRLHQARWRSKGEPGSFALPGVEQMLKESARYALSKGRLRLWTLKLNGVMSAVRLAFLDNGVVHAFQGGFDPVYAKDSLGSVMLGMCIRDCLQDPEVREYDFMGGTDSYKDWWTKAGRETVSMICLRSGIRSLAYKRIGQAQRAGRTILRAALPQTLRRAGYRLLERRHYLK